VNKENVVYMYNGVLLSHKEKWNYGLCKKTCGTGEHRVEHNKADSEKEILHVFSLMHNLDMKKGHAHKRGQLFCRKLVGGGRRIGRMGRRMWLKLTVCPCEKSQYNSFKILQES
jgi:hypothetical protein